MIVTSEMTVLNAIRIAANTGRPTRSSGPAATGAEGNARPASRPNTTNITTGTRIVPTAPIGSRRKIFVSSQVSFSSPRSILASVPDRMPGQREEHVLERRQHRAEIGHADAVLGHAVDDGGDEIAAALERVTASGARHRIDLRQRAKARFRRRILGGDDDAALRTVAGDQPLRRVGIDNP